MFRTVLKSDAAKEVVKKAIKTQTVRNIAVQSIRNKQCHRTLLYVTNNLLLNPSKYAEESLKRYYANNLPSHIRVALPALSPTMESGTIISWEKKEGDKLNEGDLLAEIETDKATMGFETPEEGYLAKILIPAGTKDVPIGKLVCIIVENEADVAAFKDFKDDSASGLTAPKPSASTPDAPSPTAAAPAAQSDAGGAAQSDAGGRVYASPMAKRLAEQRNIRLQGKASQAGTAVATPSPTRAGSPTPSHTGPAMPAAAPSGPGTFIDIPVSSMRKTIAKRLLESKQQIPHYYLSQEVNVDALLKIRSKYNKKLEKSGVKLSVNDFIIKAVAIASQKVPEANSHWLDSVMRQYKNVDVSVAVSTDKGLITPIVWEANNKGVVQISKAVKELASRARDGKLQPQEFQGGTISVSNLGMFGTSNFCAIINPPQSAILAIGTTVTRLIPDETKEKGFREAQFLTVTLSCDHRVVDGAVGARWLQVFKECMEDPVAMIL
ncbi:dihydrolipoyllysine-residue acetyltransferase component of pyruvate dehydrogenase complex, mitochondrial isoform X2 [Anthonomus grandis grandis]|uniref:dihydrolipoyllysine-residue acetyltransferase component of pyruvate dehydrogenase complex, mitochondrial isoform X2 n=1 Tax=Anthonomus grandis grandis TaxID=2921223 RepID=UPI002165DA27|nr:dihydrolipoyllysine-residue acetyltransferase component of pyruvate dehydrogenase complex, mitochondrial isoform X2 [Anthonomus grandis grandis]